MATSPIIPSRQELAQFLPNPEAVKAFEALFKVSQVSTPGSIADLVLEIGYVQLELNAAQQQANEALSRIAELVNNLYTLLPQPAPEPDIYIPPLAVGSIAVQDAGNVSITGGSVAVNTLSNSETRLMSSATTLTNYAGASVGTLNNAPAVGDPVKWIRINDNGVNRHIPTW